MPKRRAFHFYVNMLKYLRASGECGRPLFILIFDRSIDKGCVIADEFVYRLVKD